MSKYRVKIRRELAPVKPEAEQIDGKVYDFLPRWTIEEDESNLYAGETAMIGNIRKGYPASAPPWIASGDLIATEPEKEE